MGSESIAHEGDRNKKKKLQNYKREVNEVWNKLPLL